MSVALTLLGISLLIVLHEAGHFLVARACRMRVLRFSVGFGPTLLSRQVGETTYQLAAVPLGGFVEIDGMGEAGEKPPAAVGADPHTYRARPLWQRALVVAAGPAANWAVTLALLTALAAGPGLLAYDEASGRLGALTPDGAAAAAGLREGDRVLRIDGAAVAGFAAIVRAVRAHPGQALRLDVERTGAQLTLAVTPRGTATGSIGAMPPASRARVRPLRALPAALRASWAMTSTQARMLGQMLTGGGGGQLSGLPGIVRQVSRQAEEGFGRLAESLAWLSIGLCLLNLAPVPALDGSRLVLLAIEAVRRRPLDARVEGWLHSAGFALLLGTMAFVSVRDLL